MTLDDVTQFIGRFFAYGLPSIGLFWLFSQKTAERWIDAHFAKRQKEFEHEQAKELQRLKVRLDTVVQGALKLQEREFKIIPEAWEKISEALGLALWLSAPFQQTIDLEYMSEAEIAEFLEKSELLETQKSRLREADRRERNEIYREIEARIRHARCRNALSDADRFIKANGLFMPEGLKAQFSMLVELIWECLVSYQVGSQAKDYKMINEGWKSLKEKGEPLHAEIETVIRSRLSEQAMLSDELA